MNLVEKILVQLNESKCKSKASKEMQDFCITAFRKKYFSYSLGY